MSVPRMEIARSELLKEEVATTRLDCGLEVCVQRKKGYAKKYGVFATRYGSLDTRFRRADTGEVLDVPDGLAHFLEHKLFEEESGSIDDVFAELGAYSNAFTDYPLNTQAAPGTFSRKTLPLWGRIDVTPVLAGPLPGTSLPSPWNTVQWPTMTPDTSVIEFSSPGEKIPVCIPISLALGLRSSDTQYIEHITCLQIPITYLRLPVWPQTSSTSQEQS
jgi:hypothetical protein